MPHTSSTAIPAKSESPNITTTKYLHKYLQLNKPGFAVLLNGPWGTGKTYYLNKVLESYGSKHSDFEYYRISLYGVSTTGEINQRLYKILHPKLAAVQDSMAYKVGQQVVKAALRMDMDADGKPDETLNLALPDLNTIGSLKISEDRVVIFDDMERCAMDIDQIMGYINYLVECEEIKVILVANEEQLKIALGKKKRNYLLKPLFTNVAKIPF